LVGEAPKTRLLTEHAHPPGRLRAAPLAWPRSPRLAAALAVIALASARGAFLAVLVPPLQAPDEDAHVDAVQYLAETGRLAPGGWCDTFSAEVEALRASTFQILSEPERRMPSPQRLRPPAPTKDARATAGCGPASTYPPIYYATAALGYRAVYAASLMDRLLAMRLVSVLWGCAGALAAFLFGTFAFGRTRDGLLLGALWASQPQIGLMTGTVNNDAALFAISAGCFATIAALAAGARTRRALPLLALLAVAGALTKPTFTGVIPVLLVAIALALGGRRVRSWELAAAIVVPALLATWWWHRGVMPPYNPQPVWRYLATFVFDRVRAENLWVRLYWMTWGWVDTALTLEWYRLLEIVTAAAVLGVLVGWRALPRGERAIAALAAFATLTQLAFLYLIEYRVGSPILQGRYLLPMYVPQAAGCVVGLRALGRRLGARVDAGWSLALLLVVVQVASVVRALGRYHA
jgi:hypothetical protein